MVFTWRVLNALFLSSTGKFSNSILSVPIMRGPQECSQVIAKITRKFFSSLIPKLFGKYFSFFLLWGMAFKKLFSQRRQKDVIFVQLQGVCVTRQLMCVILCAAQSSRLLLHTNASAAAQTHTHAHAHTHTATHSHISTHRHTHTDTNTNTRYPVKYKQKQTHTHHYNWGCHMRQSHVGS